MISKTDMGYKVKKNCGPVSITGIAIKMLDKILAKWIDQCIKHIIYLHQQEFTTDIIVLTSNNSCCN